MKAALSAGEYDREIEGIVPYYGDIHRQIGEIASVVKPDAFTWLDVGCGTGKMAETAATAFQKCRFTLCDSSPDMLELARQRLAKVLPGCRYLCSGLEKLGFEGEFDVVSAVMVLHYLQAGDRQGAVNRLYRALRPEGILFAVENTSPVSMKGRNWMMEHWKKYQLCQGRSKEAVRQHLERCGRDYYPVALPDRRLELKRAGFRIVEVFWASYLQAGIFAVK